MKLERKNLVELGVAALLLYLAGQCLTWAV